MKHTMRLRKAGVVRCALHGLRLIASVLVSVCLVGCAPAATQNNALIVIAHGLGMIDGTGLSNSKEAFQASYRRGFRVFETDLLFTSDHALVAAHDNMESTFGLPKSIAHMSRDEFLQSRIRGKLTTQSIEDILLLLKEHPDAVLITDTKEDLEASFRALLAAAEKIDPRLLEYVIPQIYQPDDVSVLERIHPFDRYIFTLYRTNMSDDAILQFVKRTPKIFAISMATGRFAPNLAEQLRSVNVHTFVHTLNDEQTIEEFVLHGATGVYTDRYFGTMKFPGRPLPTLVPKGAGR